MRLRFLWISAWLMAAGLAAGAFAGEEGGIAARHHSWGRFPPGAWKLVRVVTETLDENGAVAGTSTTETKTSLVKVDQERVYLEVEAGVEIADQLLDGRPQFITQGFYGELICENVKIEPSAPAEVTIEDRKIPCRVQRVEFSCPNGRTVTSIYYSDAVAPYVLKRQSTTLDPSGKSLGEASLDVVALDMPFRVLADIKTAACIKSVQTSSRGSITSLAMTSADVPGGVVYQTSKETDPNGRLVRRSTLELVDFNLHPEEERQGLFGRKRPSRRKAPPYGMPR